MELSSSLHRSALHRPRKSPWPAIPMENAWSILDEQFTQYLDQLRDIEEKRANQPDLLGYILAESLHAFRPVPSFRASIKDGYALIAADGPGPHRVVSICTAGGQQEKGEIEGAMKCAGYKECVRISTGAKVPDWTDAVVPVEETTILEDDGQEELMVNIGEIAKKGQNIREIGSDVAEGELLLEKGTVIGPAEIGLVALSGKRKILVYSKPKVSIISTGDELVDFYGAEQNNEEPLIEAVMDTNRPVLLSLIRQNGFDGIDGGIVEDSQFALIEAIERSFGQVDLVVLTGGVSMGEKDLLKDILVNKFHFKIHFGRVFMKPGLPTTFASGQGPDGRQKFVFGLPGNPVSAFVTAHLFLLPQLRRIAGFDEEWQNARLAAQLSHPIGQLDPRPEYRRAILLRPQIGQPPSSPPLAQCIFGSQISSRLLSTRSANLLLELPPKNAQKEELEKGEIITALVIGPII